MSFWSSNSYIYTRCLTSPRRCLKGISNLTWPKQNSPHFLSVVLLTSVYPHHYPLGCLTQKPQSHPGLPSFHANPPTLISKSCWLFLQRIAIGSLCPHCHHTGTSQHLPTQTQWRPSCPHLQSPKVYFLSSSSQSNLLKVQIGLWVFLLRMKPKLPGRPRKLWVACSVSSLISSLATRASGAVFRPHWTSSSLFSEHHKLWNAPGF